MKCELTIEHFVDDEYYFVIGIFHFMKQHNREYPHIVDDSDKYFPIKYYKSVRLIAKRNELLNKLIEMNK
jgi:hypothetical protein